MKIKDKVFLFFLILIFNNSLFSNENYNLEIIYKKSLNTCNYKKAVKYVNYILNKIKDKIKKHSMKNKDILLLSKALDYKYGYLKNIDTNNIKEIKYFLNFLEKKYKNKKDSLYLNYALATVYGRYAESLNIFEAAKEGLADKIKKHVYFVYKKDKSFDNYNILLFLGRLHYKTPFIPFILTWPDRKKSKYFLHEYLKVNKDSLIAKYFLADILWDLNEKDKSKKLYYEVINTKISNKNCLKDKKIINECKKRAKKLNIIK